MRKKEEMSAYAGKHAILHWKTKTEAKSFAFNEKKEMWSACAKKAAYERKKKCNLLEQKKNSVCL